MNANRFNTLVEAKARQSMEIKIKNFRATIKKELCELDPSLNSAWSDFWECEAVSDLLSALQQNRFLAEKWPDRLFEQEKDETAAALLETMDIMQQAVIAADSFVPSIEFEHTKK